MKHIKYISAIVLSMALMGSSLPVNAIDSAAAFEQECNDDCEVDVFDGYSFIYGQDAVSFDSFDDYVKSSYKASKKIGLGDIYPMNCYLENYDYIYVPTYLKDKTDDILCVFVSPRFCRITYKVGNAELDTYHYFQSDGKKSCEDFQPAYDDNNRTDIGDVVYFIRKGYGNKLETYKDKTAYCCNYNGSYLLFSTEFGLENMGEIPFTKVFVDKHMQEKNGKLYYMNDKNEPQSGWKTINGHKYYFRSLYKTAICGKNANIGGVVYSFNQNGICKGKFTGYTKDINGNRIRYKDGVAVK